MPGDHRPLFGSLLKRYRRAAHLTQGELAERVGYNPNYISMLERGVRAASAPTIDLLADALELSSGDRAVFRAAAQQHSRLEPEEGEVGASSAGAPGVRTFLLADVRGYSRFTLEQGDEAAARLAERFAAIARAMAAAHEGAVIELRGDEALAVFSSARQALRAAVALQEHFAKQSSEDPSLPLKVGIGLDAGEAVPVEGGYRGAALNLAARLCSLAGPDEVLASEGVVHLARKLEGLTYVERGALQLKGFIDAVRVVQVVAEEAAEQPEAMPERDAARERPLPIGGFLGALPASPLVAREAELGKVLSVVDAVAGGSGRLVLLVGEPGIGKTRLAQEVTLALRNRSFVVASGRCYEPQEAVPFYPFLEVFGTLYVAASSSVRANVPGRWPYLGHLLPNAGLPAAGTRPEGQEAQERLFWSVSGFLQAVAEERPVALLLDDLHWADGTSLALLQHLARHTRAYRVLLLGTYRDVEVGLRHPLDRALRDLNREHLAERVSIRRLGQEETAALIATTFGEEQVSSEFAELVHRHTEGNPFFTGEVLQALVERGDIYREDGRWERREIGDIEVPESVRSAIEERLSRLSEGAQGLLYEASVLGQTFRFDDLQAMGDHSEGALDEVLEEALGADLIHERGRDGYEFNHALTQQTLYTGLSSRRRRRLHLAAGEALEKLTDRVREKRVAELAWHFLEADEPERALAYGLLAGDHSEVIFAHQEAERHYQTALGLARELTALPQETEALEKLGAVLGNLGRYDEALELLDLSIERYSSMGNLEGEKRVTAQIGIWHRARGTPEEGIARLQPLVERLEASGQREGLAPLYARLEALFFASGRYAEQVKAAERACYLASVAGDDRVLAQAQVGRAVALGMLGRPEALDAAEAALPLAEAAGDLYTLRRALTSIANEHERRGELERSHQYIERSLQVAEQADNPWWIGFALAYVASLSFSLGRWMEARAYLQRALAISRTVGPSWWSAYPLIELGRLELACGNWEEAAKWLREGLAIANRNQDLQGLRYAQAPLAELDLLEGRPAAALDRLSPLLDRSGLQEAQVTGMMPALAWAYLDAGDEAKAEEVLAQCLTRTRSSEAKLALMEALQVQGRLLTRQSRWAEAEQAFEEAVSLAHSMPHPYSEGRALYKWGRMYATKGEPVRARERLADARSIFLRLGARPYVERTRRALSALT